MKVVVFGASGSVGRLTVMAANAAGYEVRAYVHSHNPFEGEQGIEVIAGDVNDADAVSSAVAGCDVVLCCLGSWHTKGKNILTLGMESIIPAMQSRGINRIITLTGAAAFVSNDHPKLIDKLSHAMLGLVAPKIIKDAEQHLKLLESSGLDWTSIRSPVMKSNGTASYVLRNKIASPLVSIPRPAVVACMIDQIRSSDYLKSAPVIYRG